MLARSDPPREADERREAEVVSHRGWYGSFDAWVEQAVLPGVESGALEPDDMVEIVAALRDSTAVAYGPLMCDVLTETGSFRCPLIA
jgi:hypothetical protein